ncbi:hypothetical protein KUTeg_017807 [Tegillarca granosa]|uniref:Uncharacterized protein n=1 Tax=Tegillarca granosa TaxID=220873 RepID=A0ABQ9EFZ9_TEGGR|nr:hypothetical protein KUTeg_017807 [Tegillarca granosa]
MFSKGTLLMDILVNVGEEGLIIGQVPPDHTGFYKGPKEMDNKKIIRNAFKDGDKYFNFGDLK